MLCQGHEALVQWVAVHEGCEATHAAVCLHVYHHLCAGTGELGDTGDMNLIHCGVTVIKAQDLAVILH